MLRGEGQGADGKNDCAGMGNCSTTEAHGCHGANAQGAIGFPNLTDQDWLYGGTPETVLASITYGRNGMMPAFNGAIDAATVEASQMCDCDRSMTTFFGSPT